MTDDLVLTPSEVGGMLRVSEVTIRRMVRRGFLPRIPGVSVILIPRAAVDRLLTGAARAPIDDDGLRGIETVVRDEIERCWEADLLYGGDADRIDPDGWVRSTFPTAAARITAAILSDPRTAAALARALAAVSHTAPAGADHWDDEKPERFADAILAALKDNPG